MTCDSMKDQAVEGIECKQTCGTEDEKKLKMLLQVLFAATVLGWVVEFAIVLVVWPCFAVPYKSRVMDRKPTLATERVPEQWQSTGPEFRTHICQCANDGMTCLHGCCCSALRLSDTYASAGLTPFWPTYLQANGLIFLKDLLSMATMFLLKDERMGQWLGMAIFAITFFQKRGELRQKLGGSGANCADCICFWCCYNCAVCQEARLVDGALGTSTACCCDLQLTRSGTELVAQPGAVGQAVAVQRSGAAREMALVAPLVLQPAAVQPNHILRPPESQPLTVESGYAQMND